MVEGGGFEPPKLSRQIYSLIPLATREPLQKTPLVNKPFQDLAQWSWRQELNPQPADYKSAALPLSHTSILAGITGLEPVTH